MSMQIMFDLVELNARSIGYTSHVTFLYDDNESSDEPAQLVMDVYIKLDGGSASFTVFNERGMNPVVVQDANTENGHKLMAFLTTCGVPFKVN